jgi:hypothetical protein
MIAGRRNLYVPPVTSPAGYSGTQLALRLAVAPGNSAVRFSYRTVAVGPPAQLVAQYLLTSVGGTIRAVETVSSRTVRLCFVQDAQGHSEQNHGQARQVTARHRQRRIRSRSTSLWRPGVENDKRSGGLELTPTEAAGSRSWKVT